MNTSIAIPAIQKELHPFFRSLTKDPNVADDISQFAMLKCFERWQDKDPVSLKRLAFAVGRNHYFTQQKRKQNEKKIRVQFVAIGSKDRPDVHLERKELINNIRNAVKQLPMREQEIIHRLFVLEQSYEEIAMAMHTTVNTIKTWRRRCLKKLKSMLEQFCPR